MTEFKRFIGENRTLLVLAVVAFGIGLVLGVVGNEVWTASKVTATPDIDATLAAFLEMSRLTATALAATGTPTP